MKAVQTALREGRSALNELERQLKFDNRRRAPSAPPVRHPPDMLQTNVDYRDDYSRDEHSSPDTYKSKGFVEKIRYRNERQNLEKSTRSTRLNHRKDAPLGNLEDLDDRGLITGGSVPSTNSNCSPLRARARRNQEMKNRESRLNIREENKSVKNMKTVSHVLASLSKQGLSVEDHFRTKDVKGAGVLGKKTFCTLLQQLGIPLGAKGILEVVKNYTLTNNPDKVEYERFLGDVNFNKVSSIEGSSSLEGTVDGLRGNRSKPRNVLVDLRRALLETVGGLGKSIDDLYSMFYRWDSKGSGTITSAQFLRALDRLHVNLSDEDQDTLVEILDVDGMGRINFEGLLDGCFSRTTEGVTGTSMFSGEESEGGEGASTSNGSLVGSIVEGGLPEMKSNVIKKQRPATASLSRPQTLSCSVDGTDNESLSLVAASPTSNRSRRPNTASGKMGSQYSKKRGEGHDGEKDEFVIDVPDSEDVINDDFNFVGNNNNNSSNVALAPHSEVNSLEYGTHNSHLDGNGAEFPQDLESFNEQTLLSDQDDYFNSPRSPDRRDSRNTVNINREGPSAPSSGNVRNVGLGVANDFSYSRGSNVTPEGTDFVLDNLRGGQSDRYNYDDYRNKGEEDQRGEPRDHLRLLASQSLATLREMVLARSNTGKSLRDIYRHFDRKGKYYFDSKDLMQGLSDLRIETSERVADIMISSLAIDGHDKVSYGEFVTFVNDAEYKELERNVQFQLAEQLERQGRDFQVFLYNSFWSEGGDDQHAHLKDSGLVSSSTFRSALIKIGLKLSPSEKERLVSRFCVHGEEFCSVSRFLRMVQNCHAWRHAEKVLAYKEEAVEEAQTALSRLREGVQMVPGITEDTIKMAEYLGIRVLSEPQLLWIANDAFSAPLPSGWVTHRDADGRMFFHNSASNTSQWDHPLDNHFRKLRDKCREDVVGTPVPPPNAPYFATRPHSGVEQYLQLPGGDKIIPEKIREIGVTNSDVYQIMSSSDGGNDPSVIWRDAPALANFQRAYGQQHSETSGGTGLTAGSRPTSAPFASQRAHIPRPKYNSNFAWHDTRNMKLNMAYNPPSNPPRSSNDVGSKPARPRSAVSYTRKKYSFDGAKHGNSSGIGSGNPVNTVRQRKGSNSGSQSDKTYGWGKNSGASAAHAESIIDRVINYGKDTPHYLQTKGTNQVGRAQSAGPMRRSQVGNGGGSNIAAPLEQAGKFSLTSRGQKSKQLAMMYAEELIEKLDNVIVANNDSSQSNSRRSSGLDQSGNNDGEIIHDSY